VGAEFCDRGDHAAHSWPLSVQAVQPDRTISPSTNAFTVTNFAFGQSFSGTIQSSGSNVPYASVLLFCPSADGGGLGSPIGGVIANSSGAYTISAPVGTYLPLPFQSHYVSPLSAVPVLTLNAGPRLRPI